MFKEFKRGNNKWSTTNEFLDLVRYNGCSFRFYRHRIYDFVVQYSRQYPFTFDKFTYPLCHPYDMLQSKHHKIIPSWKTYPKGKRYVTVRIKPPKQLTTAWNFQHTFAEKALLQLNSSVCDLTFSYLGCCNTNRLITFYALNTDVFAKNGWGDASGWGTHGYQPYANAPTNKTTYKGYTLDGKTLTGNLDPSTYHNSINYDTGWFQPNLMRIVKFADDSQYKQLNTFVTQGRYNPAIDEGTGNSIWLVDILAKQFVKPTHDKTIILDDIPLWKAIWGFWDYVEKSKGTYSFLTTALLVIQSPYIMPHLGTSKFWIPVDQTFIMGQGPYKEYVTNLQKSKWWASIEHQQQTMNAFVQTGPFVPKLENIRDSTWELKSGYTFYFKWGGSQIPDAEAADPSKQESYAPPGALSDTVQVSDPKKQVPAGILHTWDFRRGYVTGKALKRMLQDQTASSTFQTDSEPPSPKKKKYGENTLQAQTQESKEIQTCLQQIFEESSSQDSQETEDLKHLIQQQKHKQQQLKLQLMHLLNNLKLKQKALQLHTGVLD